MQNIDNELDKQQTAEAADSSVVVLKQPAISEVGIFLLGTALLTCGALILWTMLHALFAEHRSVPSLVTGIIASLLSPLPFFWFGCMLVTPRSLYEISASGITSTGRRYFWQPNKSVLVPWYKIQRIYIDRSAPTPRLYQHAIFINELGGLYEKRLEFWNWPGDWEKAMQIIESSLPEESILKAEDWESTRLKKHHWQK